MIPISITELTNRLKSVVEAEFRFVYIVGEISNFKKHLPSGHFYFNLKDESSQICATMWSSRNINLQFKPADGQKVIVKGRVTIYGSRGTYQVDAFEMMPFGIGEMQMAFELLKQQLLEEGLFDEMHKKPLPQFPQRVGIITSEGGAVIQDFIKIANKRFPAVELYLFPVNVQGIYAVESICYAIDGCGTFSKKLDVLVLARGGGSLEDLQAFNNERLARAVFNCEIPVVSAIGHEVDFTICDFVADLRAPTPSAAAEMIFPDKNELLERINQFEYYIKVTVNNKISYLKEAIDNIEASYSFKKPADMLDEYKYRLDDMDLRLKRASNEKFYKVNSSLGYMEKIFGNIDPDRTLRRGYSIVRRGAEIISKSAQLDEKDIVDITFYDGRKSAEIK